MELVLTRDEADLLEGTLERALSDIHEEIHRADLSAYQGGAQVRGVAPEGDVGQARLMSLPSASGGRPLSLAA